VKYSGYEDQFLRDISMIIPDGNATCSKLHPKQVEDGLGETAMLARGEIDGQKWEIDVHFVR
jgi:hypothetical protein